MVSLLHLLLGNNNVGNASFSTAQCELLLCLSRQRVDLQMEQGWAPIVGPLEQNIARFISKGLLEETSLDEKFDVKYRIADLRQMFEKKGIKFKGKKHEMIAVLIGAMTPDEAYALVADVRLYKPTPAGSQKIDAYLEQKEKALKEMEAESLFHLERGDVKKAWARIARYQSERAFPDQKWSRPIHQTLHDEATELIKFPYNDLPLSEAQRRKIGAHLALSVLLGETFVEAGKRLFKYTEGAFDWAQATAFHRPSPCGVEQPGDPEVIAETYATTRIQEALVKCELDSLKSIRLGKGIKILPVNGADCNTCHSGKYLYEWSEIENLPKLPRQLGCQCTYAAWL